MQRLLGIDYGAERIGVALSDEEGRMAFPHRIVSNTDDALRAIVDMVVSTRAAVVVVGLSSDYQGRENPIMERARAFAKELEVRTDCRVVFENETLTSAQARRVHEQLEKTRKPQKREAVDASAAALILQQYIETQGHTLASA